MKTLFKQAVKAITRPDEEDEDPQRRRRGETEGEFRRLGRYLWRRFDARRSFRSRTAIASRFAPVEAHAAATAYLATTLDMLKELNDSSSDLVNEFDAIPDHPETLHL